MGGAWYSTAALIPGWGSAQDRIATEVTEGARDARDAEEVGPRSRAASGKNMNPADETTPADAGGHRPPGPDPQSDAGPETRRLGEEETLGVTPRVPPPALDPAPAPAPPARAAGGATRRAERIGKYRIVRPVGMGGMGVVYLASDDLLHRTVALKVLRTEGAADEPPPDASAAGRELARFLREARTLARFRHPNIVQIYEVGEADGKPYIAMEYVEGGTLRELLDVQATPAPSAGAAAGPGGEAVRRHLALLQDVCRAVQHAHDNGVIHRDLKPGNILLRREPAGGERITPLVADFGLAHVAGAGTQLTHTGQALGTPAYMSPEQFEGRPVDVRSDVFALGAMLYEVATGAPPFRGTDYTGLMFAVLFKEAAPARQNNPALDAALETILARALEKDPAARYPSAGALADDLGLWLAGRPIAARPVGRLARAFRLLRRHPVASGITGAALVVAVAVGLYAVLLRTWAEGEVARREAEARREGERSAAAAASAREVIRKTALAQNVLARWVVLAPTLRALERTFHDSTLAREEKQRLGQARWPQLEEFARQTPADPTSQATLKGLLGWARRLAGSPEEGTAWMRASTDLDPDVPYGLLLEALVAFSAYLELQPLPSVAVDAGGLELGPLPAEGKRARELREQVQLLLGRAERAGLWGEGLAADFRKAVTAVSACQAGRLADAEGGLTEALGTAALQVFRGDLLLYRARVRYLSRRFAAGIEDLQEVAEARPEQARVHFLLGRLHWARALQESTDGADPRGSFERAVAAYGTAARLTPRDVDPLSGRGNVWLCRGQWEAGHGLDPRAALRCAIADHEEVVRRDPKKAVGYNNRAAASAELAAAEAARGIDPRPVLSRAITDLGEVLRLDPDLRVARLNRASLELELGRAESARGGDPSRLYAAATEHAEECVRRYPDWSEGYFLRGYGRSALADLEAARGGDPQAARAGVLADFTRAVELGPGSWRYRAARADVLEGLGRLAEAEAELGQVVKLSGEAGQFAARLEALRARRRAAESQPGPGPGR